MNEFLWEPSLERIKNSKIFKFILQINQKFGKNIEIFEDLHNFSIQSPDEFWSAAYDYFGVIGHKGDIIYKENSKFYKSQFFPEATLNFAQNLLVNSGNGEAIVFWSEECKRKSYTFDQVEEMSLSFANGLKEHGLLPGDRVAAYIPNIPEAATCMIGTAAIGAIWSSCSPDFGVVGVLDRFSQIEPRILIITDGYIYGGKVYSNLEKLSGILEGLPTVEKVIVIPFIDINIDFFDSKIIMLSDFRKSDPYQEFIFEKFPFDHPLYILFSSGTTGKPKCIVHSAGRILLQHLKEHQFHMDIHPGDRIFYFTTCGWMMWNWQISALASGATLVLFDGSPLAYKGTILLDLAEKESITLFGTSAKYISSIQKANLEPIKTHEFPMLRTIASTGSPLSAESFDYIYHSFKNDVQLSSISGGTDIVGCFVLGNPIGPVYKGEIQSPGLAMKIDVFDEYGNSIENGKGELVCSNPFMSQPLKFWNDENDERLISTYFKTYPNIWYHGDYIERTIHGGFIIYGRSDTTLNPGGVRIGTAEIYRQVEKIDEVLESLVIGQEFDGDVRIILFIKLRDGLDLTDELTIKIKQKIKENTTPRHVPAKIIKAPDIPKTKSGKITEIAVHDLVHGKKINNIESIANPEVLAFYENLVIL